MTEQLGKRQHPRRLGLDIPKPVKIVAGVTLATTAAVGGGFAIADQMGAFDTGTPDQGHTLVVPPTPTPDKIQGTAIPTPTNTEAPKPTPTPEKPKTVEWSTDQIAKAQKDALANNKIALLDTWEAIGGTAENAITPTGKPILMVDYEENPEGKVFSSPVSGVITGIGQNREAQEKAFYIQVGNIEVEIETDIDSKEIVKYGQNVSAGDPIFTMSDKRVLNSLHFSKPGYVVVGDVTNFTSTTGDILKDSNGALVTLQK